MLVPPLFLQYPDNKVDIKFYFGYILCLLHGLSDVFSSRILSKVIKSNNVDVEDRQQPQADNYFPLLTINYPLSTLNCSPSMEMDLRCLYCGGHAELKGR